MLKNHLNQDFLESRWRCREKQREERVASAIPPGTWELALEGLPEPIRQQILQMHKYHSKLAAPNLTIVPYSLPCQCAHAYVITQDALSAPHSGAQRLLLGCHCELIFNHLLGQWPFGMLERKRSPQLGWGQAAGEQCPPPAHCVYLAAGMLLLRQRSALQTRKTKRERSPLPRQHFWAAD